VACARLGVILLPLNVRLAVPELQRVLLDATPRLLAPGLLLLRRGRRSREAQS
jgi:hypothetical protein